MGDKTAGPASLSEPFRKNLPCKLTEDLRRRKEEGGGSLTSHVAFRKSLAGRLEGGITGESKQRKVESQPRLVKVETERERRFQRGIMRDEAPL